MKTTIIKIISVIVGIVVAVGLVWFLIDHFGLWDKFTGWRDGIDITLDYDEIKF